MTDFLTRIDIVDAKVVAKVGEYMASDNATKLVRLLNYFDGAEACKVLLGHLLTRGNEHTLQSILALLEKGSE